MLLKFECCKPSFFYDGLANIVWRAWWYDLDRRYRRQQPIRRWPRSSRQRQATFNEENDGRCRWVSYISIIILSCYESDMFSAMFCLLIAWRKKTAEKHNTRRIARMMWKSQFSLATAVSPPVTIDDVDQVVYHRQQQQQQHQQRCSSLCLLQDSFTFSAIIWDCWWDSSDLTRFLIIFNLIWPTSIRIGRTWRQIWVIFN